jgi:hypothetical protein
MAAVSRQYRPSSRPQKLIKGVMTEFGRRFHREYARFQARFGAHLLGVVEIGSYARGEAVCFSDHDLRLIIHCDDPLLVLDEHRWTKGIDAAVTTIDWQDLNQHPDLSFGLTNLAYVGQVLETGRYPLIDHTCLYQGRILVDDTGAVAAFRDQHRGARFSNIVPDYLRQTEWRVTSRLPRELDMLTERLDHRKCAVLAIHTCYRILRDMANIASYHDNGVYIGDANGLVHYYRDHWPWFQMTFDTVRAFKTDEALRRVVFDEVVQGVSERIRTIQDCAEATASLWARFHARYR